MMLKKTGLLITISIFLYAVSLFAQEDKWTTEISDDGKTEVVYTIYDSINVDGEEITFIEYTAKTTTSASLENCSAVFNNPEMHKKFYEYTDVSEKVKDISENEWVIYYYYSPPWPIADSDCVSRITKRTDTLNKKVAFMSFSEPNLIEMKDVVRSELNDITFIFSDIGKNKVEISIEAKLIPEMSAPKWMMNGWFPDGPANTLNRFKKLAEKLNK